MGILKHLLFWPVTGPSALVRFSLRQVENTAHRELADEGRVKEDLIELHLLLELGEIDEEEYRVREAAAMERLREARAWQERLGMATPWAPIEFSGSERTGEEDS